MQNDFEIHVNDDDSEEDVMFILVNKQPNVVISPPNTAGWREVLFGIHESIDKELLLKEAEEYMVKELGFRQNNNLRNWRWNQIHADENGMRFFTANVRNTQEVLADVKS